MRWVDGKPLIDENLAGLATESPQLLLPRLTFWHIFGLATLLAIAFSLWLTERSRAEAFPVRVILSHVPTVSTWGPAEATGVVLITFSEGDVRGDFVDLPVLGSTDRYALWLLNSQSNQTYFLGKFDAKELPVTHVDLLLSEPIPETGWDSVLLTVEPEPDPDPGPDSRRVLIGAIPGTSAEQELLPPALPKTGHYLNPWPTVGLLLGNLVFLWILARLRRSRTKWTLTGRSL